MKLGLAAALLVASVACSSSSTSSPPRPALGTERGDCRPPIEAGGLASCDVGLVCLSNVCVRPAPTVDLCEQITANIRSLVDKQLAGSNDPSTQKLVGAMVDVMKTSCHEDGWPDALKQCLAKAKDDAAVTTCNAQMPPDVQQKIADRMQQAMQSNLPQTMPEPTPPESAP
jgi:hypothetical protein